MNEQSNQEDRQPAYEVDGIDASKETLVIEIARGVLAPLANHLERCHQGTASGVVRAIGTTCRKAAKVLYGEATAEDMEMPVYVEEGS